VVVVVCGGGAATVSFLDPKRGMAVIVCGAIGMRNCVGI
jgi:hypothetical protein